MDNLDNIKVKVIEKNAVTVISSQQMIALPTLVGKTGPQGPQGPTGPSGGVWGEIEGTLSDQTDLQDALNAKQNTLTFDDAPTDNSDNPVKSNGIYEALALKAPLASPALTGTPIAPTATRGTNTTQIASTAFVQDAFITSFRDVYKVKLPSVSSSKRTFTANGITANHEMIVEGFAYFSNPSAVGSSTLTITTATNSITVTGNLTGTTDIIVTLGIPRSLTAS